MPQHDLACGMEWNGGGQEVEVEVKSAGKRDRGPDHDLTNTRLGNSVYSGYIGLVYADTFHNFNSAIPRIQKQQHNRFR